MKEENQYTYFRMDFEDWPEEFDYSICENIRQVSKLLRLAEIHLDDPYRKTKVIITGIPLTTKQYKFWQEHKQLPFDETPTEGDSSGVEELEERFNQWWYNMPRGLTATDIWLFLKPHISALVEEKEKRIKELEERIVELEGYEQQAKALDRMHK